MYELKFFSSVGIRILLMSIAGVLFVGAEGAWHALGYLNLSGWFLEWGDIIFAFVCVYLSVRGKPIVSPILVYVILAMACMFSIFSYLPALGLQVVHSTGPVYYIVYGISVIAAGYIITRYSKSTTKLRYFSLWFFLIIFLSILLITLLFAFSAPVLPTDETVMDLYSAHLFLQGLNPYNPNLASNAFTYYNFPLALGTPITTGGYVNTLTYPALSFIMMIPAVLFHIRASLISVPFFVLPVFLSWYRAWSKREYLLSMLILIPFLTLTIYTNQVQFSDDDIVWASLLMVSYFALPRIKLSGFMFGLSLAVKQFPAVVLPFMVYYAIKEYGGRKATTWLIFAVIAFMVVNAYFILLNPSYFISSMIANEVSPIIGVGFGISQISFLGFVQIPRVVFAFCMVAILIISLVIYIVYYEKIKFAMFVFPIIIFFFNYRFFIQYSFYWMILSILPLIDLINSNSKDGFSGLRKDMTRTASKKNAIMVKFSAVIIGVVILSTIGAGYYVTENNPGHFSINSLSFSGYNATGFVDSISVNMLYNGNIENGTQVLFRVVLPEPVINVNSLLWKPANNVTLYPGQNQTIEIVPAYPSFSLPSNTSFRMVAYYGSITGSYQYA